MRIETARSSERSKRIGARRGLSEAQTAFPDLILSDAPAAPAVQETLAGAGLVTPDSVTGDNLLLLQGQGAASRQRGAQAGEAMLRALDSLHEAMLEAQRPDSQGLLRLKHLAERPPEPSGDPQLDTVLALIRQRTAVELAKREAASDSRSE